MATKQTFESKKLIVLIEDGTKYYYSSMYKASLALDLSPHHIDYCVKNNKDLKKYNIRIEIIDAEDADILFSEVDKYILRSRNVPKYLYCVQTFRLTFRRNVPK